MSIKQILCPKCGKETRDLTNSLCIECFLKEVPINIPTNIKVRYCVKCNCVYQNRFWSKSLNSINQIFEKELKRKIKLPNQLELKDIHVEDYETGIFSMFLSIGGHSFEMEEKTEFILQKTACPDCSRENTKYIAKIQVRFFKNFKRNKEALHRFMKDYSAKLIRFEEFDKGIDYHFSVDSYAVDAARQISKRFKSTIKETFELFSWQKDKNRPRTRRVMSLRCSG